MVSYAAPQYAGFGTTTMAAPTYTTMAAAAPAYTSMAAAPQYISAAPQYLGAAPAVEYVSAAPQYISAAPAVETVVAAPAAEFPTAATMAPYGGFGTMVAAPLQFGTTQFQANLPPATSMIAYPTGAASAMQGPFNFTAGAAYAGAPERVEAAPAMAASKKDDKTEKAETVKKDDKKDDKKDGKKKKKKAKKGCCA